MRRCAHADQVREALATDTPLTEELAVHAASCSECTGIRARARRFEERLDAATADLITDALPPSLPAIARGVPRTSGRGASPGVLLGALASTALVAFAAVGVIVTGASVADSFQGVPGAGPDATQDDPEAVQCYLGNPTVQVAAVDRGTPDESRAVIAYCIGAVDSGSDDRGRAISCARSVAVERERGREAEAGRTPRPDASDPTYLRACTHVVDVEVRGVDQADDQAASDGPSVPLLTWERADSAAGWPLLRPQWLPDGYELAALQGFGSLRDTERIASVSATYLRAGTALTVEQFLLPEPEGFRIELSIPGEQLYGVSTGQTTVGDQPAFWADGVITTAAGAGFDVDALVLTWASDGIGYRITSRFDDLDVLRRIAESLNGE